MKSMLHGISLGWDWAYFEKQNRQLQRDYCGDDGNCPKDVEASEQRLAILRNTHSAIAKYKPSH